jgi:hypothetical protein
LTGGLTYYFVLWSGDEVPNWSNVSNTAVGQPGWIGQGETQRILGTAQVVSDSSSGVTVSSVAVQASGYTADGNLTNVEVWVSSSGYIDANAIRLENTAKAFSSNAAVFTQNVTVSTTPLYFIARSRRERVCHAGTFDIASGLHHGAHEPITHRVHKRHRRGGAAQRGAFGPYRHRVQQLVAGQLKLGRVGGGGQLLHLPRHLFRRHHHGLPVGHHQHHQLRMTIISPPPSKCITRSSAPTAQGASSPSGAGQCHIGGCAGP